MNLCLLIKFEGSQISISILILVFQRIKGPTKMTLTGLTGAAPSTRASSTKLWPTSLPELMSTSGITSSATTPTSISVMSLNTRGLFSSAESTRQDLDKEQRFVCATKKQNLSKRCFETEPDCIGTDISTESLKSLIA